MNGDGDDTFGEYASPPCFMHELDPAFRQMPSASDPQQRRDVMKWRKAERERLIAARLELSADTRRGFADRISAAIESEVGDFDGLTVSAYWPFRGEPDLRPLLARIGSKGGRAALPVVVEKGRPLVFRSWKSGEALERGVWNIPVPSANSPVVTPDIVIAPVVGFDPACYRLGYGGGFFDRTLAAITGKPRVIGVGYAMAAIATIYPQPHDIAMDMVITETGVSRPSAAGA